MRRPLLVAALVTAVSALVASAAVAVATLGGPTSGPPSGRSMMLGGQSAGAGMMGGQSAGTSMMGGQAQSQGAGMMGGSMMGAMGAMGGMGMVWLPGDGVTVSSMPAARARAARAAVSVGLHPGEVLWFDNGFYVELKDGAGKAATEVLVDPRTGSVSTEPGPAMMWNTRFGMHTRGAGVAVDSVVDVAKARRIATSWLTASRAGTTIASIDAYPGYFTVDLKRSGVVSGMLSVSSGSGAVWYHTWHGTFIAMEDN